MKDIILDLQKLTEPATPVELLTEKGPTKTEGLEIITELQAVLDSNPDLLAISAPQIGINKRVLCIKFNDVVKAFINPVVTKKSGCVISPETCASMPGKEILIARPEELTVVYYNNDFKYEDNKLLGDAAKIFDQQVQLLDGITPDMLGIVSDVEEDGSLADCTEEEFSQLVDIYKKFVEYKTAGLKKEISENETSSALFNQLSLTEKIINGRAEVIIDEHDPKVTAAKAASRKAANQAHLKQFLGRKK